jgi:2-keto-4-pentenoate hydratase
MPGSLETQVSLEQMAERLFSAERYRAPIEPLTDSVPGLTADDAYQIQLTNVRRRLHEGGLLRGHKIGLTAKAMRDLMGIDEPDYGHLFSDMFVLESSDIPADRFISPRIEIESAVILGRRLAGPGITVADVIRAVEWVLPSFEIIDSRIKGWRIKLADTVADNGSSAGVVLGGCPRRLGDVDLRNLSADLYLNGQLAKSGNTGDVLGNPLSAVAWLGNALARYGVALEEGHVVLPGACTAAVPVGPGSVVQAKFKDLGDVEVRFI